MNMSLKWRLTRRMLGHMVFKAVHRVLVNRTLTGTDDRSLRWLSPEVHRFVAAVQKDVETLRPNARLDTLPSFGNRLMVELAIYTVACDRVLRRMGIASASARGAVADLCWDVYRRMLLLTSLPVRLVTRNPGQRLQWTIGMLLHFPFSAPGPPGYEVETWVEGDDLLTFFSHCPPQTYVRRLSEESADPEVLESFRASWCLYDWPGADLIAADGRRGHYRRRRTLSAGDSVCDMCWMAEASDEPPSNCRRLAQENASEADQSL